MSDEKQLARPVQEAQEIQEAKIDENKLAYRPLDFTKPEDVQEFIKFKARKR